MTERPVRDSRSPIPLDENVTRSMKGNRRKDTGPEIVLRRGLREAGHGGYRLQWKIPGRPDIAYPGKKVAIFVNGCFWHRCPTCNLPIPKNNAAYWMEKFRGNVERDRRDTRILEDDGWTVITVWECEIRKDLAGTVDRVLSTFPP
jgi:DNA mismatch endonuclease, patch repair protein